MSRPQFSLKTLLWLMGVVAVLIGAAILGLRKLESEIQRSPSIVKPHE